jgi:TatD DNase family protein
MGFYIGVGGVITFKNARKLIETVEAIPLTSIVLETDCPYLAPEPHRGKRNDSSLLPLVATKISEIKGVSVDEIIRITTENAYNVYRINK